MRHQRLGAVREGLADFVFLQFFTGNMRQNRSFSMLPGSHDVNTNRYTPLNSRTIINIAVAELRAPCQRQHPVLSIGVEFL